jgi:hypothetical protein
MLRIKIELIPFGDESKAVVIDTMTIANTGTHPSRPVFGSYVARTDNTDGMRIARVENHKRSDGPWKLLQKALVAEWSEEPNGES